MAGLEVVGRRLECERQQVQHPQGLGRAGTPIEQHSWVCAAGHHPSVLTVAQDGGG
uniref:Uncharacterized protein n=1 Tax=Arundo donax TaxID=35708 RepID=A0A0A9DGN9_ARUDO